MRSSWVDGGLIMDDVKLSPPERMLLEALSVAPDLPKIQDRAVVILRAADGGSDEQIAIELRMRRKDVFHWRKRFLTHGIRGLWDAARKGPVRKATAEKKQAVVWDTLYGEYHLHWDAKLLAKKHGLNRWVVHRIWKEYGLKRARYGLVDINEFRVSADPLFGVSLAGIAGMFGGRSEVLALLSVARPFSELTLVTADSAVQQSIETFLAELAKIEHLRNVHRAVIYSLKSSEEKVFAAWLNTLEARREPEAEIHLITGLPRQPPLAEPAHQQWLAEHPQFHVHYAPLTRDVCWATLLKRWFQVITALPMQAGIIPAVVDITQFLTSLSDDKERLGILAVMRPLS